MSAAPGDVDVAALLRSLWAMPDALVRSLAGGMNSESALAAAGLVTGAPVPAPPR